MTQIKPLLRLLVPGLVLALLLGARAASAQDAPAQPFDEWLDGLRAEALQRGIRSSTLDDALAEVREPTPRVVELDRNQPEFTQTFAGYMRNRLSQARIERGRALLVEHRDLFERIRREYGVQPHYLVAFWALESNFGDYTGGFSVVNALATLAWDRRRSDFFRGELLTALEIIDAGHIAAERMTGSWAGAMGQCQFMPSTFASYGRDGDGDGRIDIWHSLPDIFASAANFLASSGWNGDERWGREVLLPKNFDYRETGKGVRKTVSEWNRLGVTKVDGSALGQAEMRGSILLPSGAEGPAFLVYDNFRTILVWNRSDFYAISVGHLADRFVGGAPISRMNEDERALSRDEVSELQERLNALGHDAGEPDGVLGSRTRSAVRAWQAANDQPTDGHPSYELLTTLRVLTLAE